MFRSVIWHFLQSLQLAVLAFSQGWILIVRGVAFLSGFCYLYPLVAHQLYSSLWSLFHSQFSHLIPHCGSHCWYLLRFPRRSHLSPFISEDSHLKPCHLRSWHRCWWEIGPCSGRGASQGIDNRFDPWEWGSRRWCCAETLYNNW